MTGMELVTLPCGLCDGRGYINSYGHPHDCAGCMNGKVVVDLTAALLSDEAVRASVDALPSGAGELTATEAITVALRAAIDSVTGGNASPGVRPPREPGDESWRGNESIR